MNIEFLPLDEQAEYTEYIKVNLPYNKESEKTGAGFEGVWCLVDKTTKAAHDSDEIGTEYEGVLDNDSLVYNGLNHGEIIPIIMNGENRPFVPFYWLVAHYGNPDFSTIDGTPKPKKTGGKISKKQKAQIEKNCHNPKKLDCYTANVLDAVLTNERTLYTKEFEKVLQSATNEEFLTFIFALRLLHDSAIFCMDKYKNSREAQFVDDNTLTERMDIINEVLDKEYEEMDNEQEAET